MKSLNERHLLLDLIAFNSKIHRQLGSALSVHGLGVSEFLVLRQLDAAPNQRLRRIDLAEQVGLSASGVTRLLNPMEKIGLVRKEESPRDARVSLVALAPAGKRTLEEVIVTVDDRAKSLLGPLSTEQQGDLHSMLGRLA